MRKNRRTNTRKKWVIWLSFILLLIALILIYTPYFAKERALLSIRVYDRYQERYSVQEKIGLEINFPLDQMDLFPLLVTYNDDAGLSRFLGQSIQFTVEYTFADFQHGKGYSQIYDQKDPLYNAYIGTYSLIGFGKKLTEKDLMLISEYDMLYLALPAVGLSSKEGTFDIMEHEIISQDLFLSSYPFTAYESTILTNGPEHDKSAFTPGDILFGSSPRTGEHYPLIDMKGKIYLYYDEKLDLNLAFYTLGTSDDVIMEFEEKIIKNIEIIFN